MRVHIGEDGQVRRPAYPWTATVHSLLRHLRAAGLEVPEPVAIELGGPVADGASIGTEVVTAVPGTAGSQVWSLQATDDGLRSAARLLRRMHDAARDFTPAADATWALPGLPGDTICHGDPGPWNMAWRGGVAVGLFDWDLARPGPAADDVAYALDYLAPLRSDADCRRWHGFAAPPDRGRRVRIFLEAYGMELDDVPGAVMARKRRTELEVRSLADRGVQPQARWVAEGYLETNAEHLAWAERHAYLLAPPGVTAG